MTDEEKALIQTYVSGTVEGELTRTISSTDDGRHYSEAAVTVSYAPEGNFAYTQSGDDKGDDTKGFKVNNTFGNTSGSYNLDKDGLDTSSKSTTSGDNSVGSSSHLGMDGQLGFAFTLGLAGGATVSAGIKSRKGRNYIYVKKTEESDLVSDTAVSITHEEGTVYDRSRPQGETVKLFDQTFQAVAGVSAEETIWKTSPQSRTIQEGINSLWDGVQKAGAVTGQVAGSALANSVKISNDILNYSVSHPVEATVYTVAAVIVIAYTSPAVAAAGLISLGSFVISQIMDDGDKHA